MCDDDFTVDLTQGEKLISIFYNIFSGNSYKNLHFARISVISIRLWFLSKSFFLDVETTFRQTVPSRNLQCSPRGDPSNLCANARIRLLTTHSLVEIHSVERPYPNLQSFSPETHVWKSFDYNQGGRVGRSKVLVGECSGLMAAEG